MAKEAMARMGIDEDAVIMAHELTHALQDQFIGLKTLPMEIEDDDDLVTAIPVGRRRRRHDGHDGVDVREDGSALRR